MGTIEKLDNTVEVEFNQEKADINMLENTFMVEDGKGENEDVTN